MKEELHLFILWKNALDKKEKIIKDITSKFELIQQYAITWSDEKYSENLSRFYGTKLPNGCDKETHCGRGTFLLLMVKDHHPKYDVRKTTAGEAYVNTNMFDAKSLYRKWTGGGHKVHGTNTVEETNHDLTLLLNKNSEDFLKEYRQTNTKEEVISLEKDLFGANGFKSVEEMFYALNNCAFYAILRNYETLPNEIYVNKHNDIDLICDSRENVAYVLNAKKAQDLDYRVQYYVTVDHKIANFDLRYVGDQYYEEELERDLLKNRVFCEKGFYILSKEEYFYTLLYHALIHKREFANDYRDRLKKMNSKFSEKIAADIVSCIKFLEEWLVKHCYIVEKPMDQSVYFNTNCASYFSKLVYRENKREAELMAQVNQLTEQLDKIKFSRTWRYTEFIRKINQKRRK